MTVVKWATLNFYKRYCSASRKKALGLFSGIFRSTHCGSARLWFGINAYPTVGMVSTRAVLCDPKPIVSSTWHRLVILCSRMTLNSYNTFFIDVPYDTLNLLCCRKTMQIHCFACCRLARCDLHTSRTNMNLLYHVLKTKIFEILLHKFDCLLKHQFQENTKFATKMQKLRLFLLSPQLFDYGSETIQFWKNHIEQTDSELLQVSKAYWERFFSKAMNLTIRQVSRRRCT